MPRQLALFIYVLLILWLFVRDRKLRPMTSWALWLPLLWLMIIASRPISFWFGGGLQVETPDDYLEGSPLDRNVYLLLMIMGLVVLLRRRVNWGRIFASNHWLFAFFFYCGVSVLWSDYSFVALKRWIKDFGNVVMVLVILTEKDPVQAARAVFARCTYFAIVLSVLFIKYYAELGKYYHRWTWQTSYCGVTTEKNALGCIAFLFCMFLVWDLIETRNTEGRNTDRTDLFSRVVLLLMGLWLLDKANSATAWVCLILGVGILVFMSLKFGKRQIRHLGKYSLAVGFLILLLCSVPGIREAFVGTLERDMTLTGRTDLWAQLLSEPINPLFGTGYQSFWLGDRMERYWEMWFYRPNQAHNGYLETYLNGGLVGLGFLIAMIISTGSNLKKKLLLGGGDGILRYSFFVVAILYNFTEAMFNKMTPLWVFLLFTALNYPRTSRFVPENMEEDNKN